MKWISLFVVLFFKRYNHYSFTVSETGFFNSIRAKQFIMSKLSGFVIAVVVVLIAGVLIAGCTNSASVNTTPAQTSAITTNPVTTAHYIAGDIVRSSQADAETGYLILKYDSGSDSYERAFIYRNSDGSWGYRVDSSTGILSRSALEKVYTVKITHVDPSQIPLKNPAVITSSVTAVTTLTGTVATTSTLTTTSTIAMKPKISGITPENGKAGTSDLISDIMGVGFQSGASVILIRSDSQNISATNVNVLSSTHISCTFKLPSDAKTGVWDVMINNPDGQSYRYANGFRVLVNTVTTTTTSASGGITITSIDPTIAYSGQYKQITVFGSNFKDGITGKLTNGYTDIPASESPRTSETQMQCFFQLPSASCGSWNLVLTNTDGTTGTLTNALVVNC